MDIIRFSREAKKSILKLQKELRKVFSFWIKDIQKNGYEKAKAKYIHKEHALKGYWKGYISLKLNRLYRVIYKVNQYKGIHIIHIERVSKHDYKK